MKHFFSVLMIFICLSFVLIFNTPITNALSFPPAFPPYRSLGARVISYILPPVAACIGLGVLVMTTGSILPIYTTNPLKFPTMGGVILGTVTRLPSVTTCFNPSTGIPIPVSLTTSNYGTTFK